MRRYRIRLIFQGLVEDGVGIDERKPFRHVQRVAVEMPGEQHLAGGSEPGLFRRAIEQSLAQPVFQAADGLADGRLRSAELLGCTRKTSRAAVKKTFSSSNSMTVPKKQKGRHLLDDGPLVAMSVESVYIIRRLGAG